MAPDKQGPADILIGVRGLPARGILSLGVMGLGPGQFEGFVFRLFFFFEKSAIFASTLRKWEMVPHGA